MDPLPFRGHFRQVAREQDTAVQAGIERAEVVDVFVLNGDPAQDIVPGGTAFRADLVESLAFHFLEVGLSLFEADERGRDFEVYNLAFSGREADQGLGMFRRGLFCIRDHLFSIDDHPL